MYKKQVKTALDALRDSLVSLGANPYRIDLPRPAGVMKVGVDDFLVIHSRRAKKAFEELERIPLFLPEGVTGTDLLKKEFEDTVWVIDNLIPAGLVVCAGKPKIGKSWLVLALAVAVSSGKNALENFRVSDTAEAIYLALEDSEARLQDRLNTIGVTAEDVKNVHLFCTWPSVEDGGLLALERWLEQHPKCRIVFIDTLAKVRKATKNDYSYYDDYDAISLLKSIADKFQVGIVLVHHLRKQASDDPFDMISGTTGIAGSADTNIVLMRDRNSGDAVLHITGRDILEQSLAMSFSDGLWKVIGEATHVHATKTQQEILLLLLEIGEEMTPSQIAQHTNRSVGGLSKTLRKMVDNGLLERLKGGKYKPKKAPKKYAKVRRKKITKGNNKG